MLTEDSYSEEATQLEDPSLNNNMPNHPNIQPVDFLFFFFFSFVKLNHKTMGTESCKTKDLEHNTGGHIKSVIDGILMIFVTSPGMLTE